jgi:hypothetical protein
LILTSCSDIPSYFNSKIAGNKIVSLKNCLSISKKDFHIDKGVLKSVVFKTSKDGFTTGYRSACFNGEYFRFTKQEADVLEAAERKLEEERKKRTRTGGIGSKLAGFRWDAFAFGAFVFLAGGALMAKMLWKKEEPIAVSVPVVQLAPPIAHEPKLVTPPVLAKKEVPPPVQVPEAPVQPKSKPAAPAVVAVLKRENASVNGCSVLFNSKPAKASLVVNGENKGLTPLVAQVACGSNQKISVELDGYEKLEKTVVVRKSGSKMTLVLKKHE